MAKKENVRGTEAALAGTEVRADVFKELNEVCGGRGERREPGEEGEGLWTGQVTSVVNS